MISDHHPQLEDAKAIITESLRAMLRAEDYGSAAAAVKLLKLAAPDLGRALERRMPAMVINNSPAFIGDKAMRTMRWTRRTPDWHDQLRRHAASPTLPMVVGRISAEIDEHERGDQ